MIFRTETGSTYEVNSERSRVRRLGGKGLPTARIGVNGAWRDVDGISIPEVGKHVYIIWNSETIPHISGTIPTTITSRVVEVKDEIC